MRGICNRLVLWDWKVFGYLSSLSDNFGIMINENWEKHEQWSISSWEFRRVDKDFVRNWARHLVIWYSSKNLVVVFLYHKNFSQVKLKGNGLVSLLKEVSGRDNNWCRVLAKIHYKYLALTWEKANHSKTGNVQSVCEMKGTCAG